MIVRIKTPRYLLNCNDQIKTKAKLITTKSFCYCSYYCTSSRVYKKEGDTDMEREREEAVNFIIGLDFLYFFLQRK